MRVSSSLSAPINAFWSVKNFKFGPQEKKFLSGPMTKLVLTVLDCLYCILSQLRFKNVMRIKAPSPVCEASLLILVFSVRRNDDSLQISKQILISQKLLGVLSYRVFFYYSALIFQTVMKVLLS